MRQNAPACIFEDGTRSESLDVAFAFALASKNARDTTMFLKYTFAVCAFLAKADPALVSVSNNVVHVFQIRLSKKICVARREYANRGSASSGEYATHPSRREY